MMDWAAAGDPNAMTTVLMDDVFYDDWIAMDCRLGPPRRIQRRLDSMDAMTTGFQVRWMRDSDRAASRPANSMTTGFRSMIDLRARRAGEIGRGLDFWTSEIR